MSDDARQIGRISTILHNGMELYREFLNLQNQSIVAAEPHVYYNGQAWGKVEKRWEIRCARRDWEKDARDVSLLFAPLKAADIEFAPELEADGKSVCGCNIRQQQPDLMPKLKRFLDYIDEQIAAKELPLKDGSLQLQRNARNMLTEMVGRPWTPPVKRVEGRS